MNADPNDERPFPVANPTIPYWRTELHPIDSHRSTDELPEECDVLIIGAGLSGVSTAYHLLVDNPSPPSAILLDARGVCEGATGRNGGHLMKVWSHIDRTAQEFGLEAAKELALFQQSQVFAMKAVALKEDLDCDFVLTRCSETMRSQAQADRFEKVYRRQVEEGLDFMDDIQFIGPKYAEKLSGIKEAKASITSAGAQLWPYKFVTGLLARILEKTALNLQTHTCVTSVKELEDGTSVIKTARGTIRAKKVVLATNAYTAGIMPAFDGKIVPYKGTCCHISVDPDTKHPPPHLSQTYGVSDEQEQRDYLVPRPDGGVICGGAEHTYKGGSHWFGNFDDSEYFSMAHAHFETVMQRNFAGWEQSGAAVDQLWTGIMARTRDQLPLCGRVPRTKNQFILAGFNGAGMPHIFLTGRGIARMVAEDVPFGATGIPWVFEVTKQRLVNDVERE